MKTFKDREGMSWDVDLNVAAVKRVRDLAGVDLLSAAQEGFERLFNDPIAMVDAIYAICKPQAEERKISDEEFGRRMAGDSIDDAYTAFLEEFPNFFQNPLRRKLMRQTVEKVQAVERRALKMSEKILGSAALEDKINEVLEEARRRALGESGG